MNERPLPETAVLVDVLARLGRSVTVAPTAPEGPTRLHLARTLVAVAEVDALLAEHALRAPTGDTDEDSADVRDDTDIDDHQGTYDAASARQALTRLALNYWRAQRLSAGVSALGAAMHLRDLDDDPDSEPASALDEVWHLTTSQAAACEGLLGVMARLTITDNDTTTVPQLDIVTALLATLGEHATRLRTDIGFES